MKIYPIFDERSQISVQLVCGDHGSNSKPMRAATPPLVEEIRYLFHHSPNVLEMLGYKFQFDWIINKLVREKSTECFLTPLRLFF